MTEYAIPGTGSWDLAQLQSTRLAEATTTNQPTDIKVDILQYFMHSLQGYAIHHGTEANGLHKQEWPD